jgi:hypothetical protein
MKRNIQSMKNTLPRGILTLLIICFVSVQTTSCRRKAIKADSNYIGQWSEDDLTTTAPCRLSIEIDRTGQGIATSLSGTSDCRRYGTHKGTVKVNGSTMRIGTKVYDLQQPPTFIDTVKVMTDYGEGRSNISMKIDGLILYKLIGGK